jgi:hypothetical protein
MIRQSALLLCLAIAACTPAGEPSGPAAGAPAETRPDIVAADEKPVAPGDITVMAPAAGARVTSPLVVEGVAINSFFFEGVFTVELVADGETIAQAPAEQQAPTNWTEPGPVNFRATLQFDVASETQAQLVLREDMPAPASADSDIAGPARTLRIPVVLVPSN